MSEQLPIEHGSRRKWVPWTIAWALYWVVLFVIMHVPIPRQAHLPLPHADLLIHFGAYFVLALVGVRAAFSRGVDLTGRWFIKWFIIYMVYGAVDELLQGPAGRTTSAADWLADTLGAACALAMCYVNVPRGPDDEDAEERTKAEGPLPPASME